MQRSRQNPIDDDIYFRSLSEVAALMGVTRQRIQKIEADAISKLQKKTGCSRQQIILNLALAAEYSN
jgi:DNA-directed RNA polymerase sigma subunit (sigma70/sigma32)